MDGEETIVASDDIVETTTNEDAASSDENNAEVEDSSANVQDESAESSDRPSWLPENFKSPEDLAKSYSELQSKLGNHKATEQKAQLLDQLLANPGLLPQLNMQNSQTQQQPQIQRDQYGRRVVTDDELRGYDFHQTRDLLLDDMMTLLGEKLKPYEPVLSSYVQEKTNAEIKQMAEAMYNKYPDVKENSALEERMAANIARGVPVDQAYKSAKESLTKELDELRKSIRKETEDAKNKSGDVSSSGSVSDERRARTMQEAAAIAKSRLSK